MRARGILVLAPVLASASVVRAAERATEPTADVEPPSHAMPPEAVRALRAGAWDRSLALETAGEVGDARALLERAWGSTPEGYEVSLRLAWLALQEGEVELAAGRYRRARRMAGAGPEARAGLVSALTSAGFEHVGDGERADARADFVDALALEPDRAEAVVGLASVPSERFEPEVWGAFVGWSAGSADAYGGAVFVALPLAIADDFRLRLGYRHLELYQSSAGAALGPGPGSSRRVRFGQDEGYAGAGWDGALFGVEALGFVLSSSGDALFGGQAARVRAGRRFGVMLDEAFVGTHDGRSVQLLPRGFVWPLPWLGLAAGARVGLEPEREIVSGVLDVTVVEAPVAFYLRGHVGRQSLAVDFDAPAVLDAAGDLTLGGAATLYLTLDPAWALGLQGEVHRLVLDDATGTHESASLGLSWRPSI